MEFVASWKLVRSVPERSSATGTIMLGAVETRAVSAGVGVLVGIMADPPKKMRP